MKTTTKDKMTVVELKEILNRFKDEDIVHLWGGAMCGGYEGGELNIYKNDGGDCETIMSYGE